VGHHRAGQGIQLLSVWRDQAQLVHRYGDRAKVLLSGLADVGALELGFRLIGDQAVTETNYSTNPTGRVAASQATSCVSPSTSASTTRAIRWLRVLVHFDQRYEHAGHYTGWAEDLDHRVAEHLAGRRARLIEVITQAGIGLRLAGTWPGVTRARERQLKRQGGASRHCPICQEDRKARGLPRRPTREQPGRRTGRLVPTYTPGR
jgi:hypothetical protein